MKKRTAGLALAAVTGFSILSATPAFAMTTPYPNCDAAAADGVYNIPAGDPRYAPALDRDKDGIACENPDSPPSDPPTSEPSGTSVPTMPTDQMSGVPKGGVDAGVATEKGMDFGPVALGGGLLLAAAGAGTYVIRRRNGNHA
ncbi:hypothetical protein ABIB35_002216 [Arthrobacter sp. UYP6]|uniref:excalibur calcium-binding domain-containing protein n=1 Tax=Arthrobacter sp. UYP6 TaxID=1756378 RepID=UPI00339424A5